MLYLNGIRDIGLTFTPFEEGQREGLIRLFAWADVVYAVHVDSPSQLGTYAYIDRQTQHCQESSS